MTIDIVFEKKKMKLKYYYTNCFQCQFCEEEWHGRRRWYFCNYDINNRKRVAARDRACVHCKYRFKDF